MEQQIQIKCSVTPTSDNSHPNKSPFTGILCSIDSPSISVPNGSNGKRVQLSSEAVQNAIETLVGMPVNANYDDKKKFDMHNPKEIIGQISNAYIKGNDIWIEGYLYPQNCPEICASIKKEKKDLGFSYELLASQSEIKNDIMYVTELVFTGAALLYKDCAAYGDDSQLIAAQKKRKDDVKMEDKDINAMVMAILAGIDEKNKKEQEVDLGKQVSDLVSTLATITASIEENKKSIEEVALEIGVLKTEKVEASKVETPVFEDGVDYKYNAETKEFVKIEAAKEEPKAEVPIPTTLQAGKEIVANKDLTGGKKDFTDEKAKIWANKELSPLQKLSKIAKLK